MKQQVFAFLELGNEKSAVGETDARARIRLTLREYSGTAENKKLQDLLPGIINQLGSDNLEHLKTIAGAFQVSPPSSVS